MDTNLRLVRVVDGVIVVAWDDQLMHYQATSIEFPGCIGTGPNEADAMRGLRQSVIDYLALEEQGYRDPGASLYELVPNRH